MFDNDKPMVEKVETPSSIKENTNCKGNYLLGGGCGTCFKCVNAKRALGDPILRYFECDHLPAHLITISRPIRDLAFNLDENLPDGPEKSAGLRKLLEAKDCFVRSLV